MKIAESQENYLKTIFLLQQAGLVRAIDIARTLGFSKPSVSRAVHLLEERGLLIINAQAEIKLTPSGLVQAETLVLKHQTIKQFLMNCLGIKAELAELEACRIEHIISEDTFSAMQNRLKNSCWISHSLHNS